MSERTTFTAWITKYALTEGIQTIKVEDCFNISDRMVTAVGRQGVAYHKPDWHRTREEAVARAEAMREAKIVSLRKRLDRMEALSFTNKEAAE